MSVVRTVAALSVVLGGLACSSTTAAPGYRQWLGADPVRRTQVDAFAAYLKTQHVSGIVPMDQLLLSATSWSACNEPAPWSVAEQPLWPHVVETLKYVRDVIVPALGPVAAVSGYRDETLNACSHGAPHSAHREFYALDLVPQKKVDRAKLIAVMCRLYAERGASYHLGLGFYDGVRFHVDSKGYRLWGPDFHFGTSPCLTGPAPVVAHPVSLTVDRPAPGAHG